MSACRATLQPYLAHSCEHTDRGKILTLLLQVEMFPDAYSAAKGSHALCVLTEWDEFKELDYEKIYNEMVGALPVEKSCSYMA